MSQQIFIEYKKCFNDILLNGESLLDYTSLFSPNKYEKYDKLKYFQ